MTQIQMLSASEETAMKKIIGLLPGVAFFIYFLLDLEEIKASSIFGLLAISVAVGSVGYFYFNSPQGVKVSETAFGIAGRYRNPVHGTIIPLKTAAYILLAIIGNCILGLILYVFGY